MGKVIVITSGKGGTGKTSLTGGLGAALAQCGCRVLCLDADVGLRNLDITLGMADAALMDFTDVIAGRCPLDRAVAPHPGIDGLYLLTAPLSLPEDFSGTEGFRGLLEQARAVYDWVLWTHRRVLDMGSDWRYPVQTGQSWWRTVTQPLFGTPSGWWKSWKGSPPFILW